MKAIELEIEALEERIAPSQPPGLLGEGTVQVHLHNIYGRLAVKSRLALALYARESSLA
jgi:hypothetical protein